MSDRDDHRYMAQALRLARLGLYTTEPNPRVGCVLVSNGEVVGEGWHRRVGGLHAERIAIAAAGQRAQGATAYVTLEPCCHHGRTPPCTDALLESGVSRVVAAMVDPNPLIAGRGLDWLQGQGIETSVGVLECDAQALNPGFIKRMQQGLPYVRCKLAASLDGRTAMSSGESKWITSEAARRDVQFLRARSSAIVTGIGTVLEDDPSMNVRLECADLPGIEPGKTVRQPIRVIVDSQLRIPADARVLNLPGQSLLACTDHPSERVATLETAGVHVYISPESGEQVDLLSLFEHLARHECNEVLLESGPTLAGAALSAGLIDELVLYLAPHLMGDGAMGLFHLPGLEAMRDRIALDVQDVRRVGPDIRITARPVKRKRC